MRINGINNVEVSEIDHTNQVVSVSFDIEADQFLENPDLWDSEPGNPESKVRQVSISDQLSELPNSEILRLALGHIRYQLSENRVKLAI